MGRSSSRWVRIVLVWFLMPRKRPPKQIWQEIRRKVYLRDEGMCQYPFEQHPVSFEEFHCDHIVSGKLGSNRLSNLRVLCRKHHVLRLDHRHRGMIANALRDGIIGPDWRSQVWDG